MDATCRSHGTLISFIKRSHFSHLPRERLIWFQLLRKVFTRAALYLDCISHDTSCTLKQDIRTSLPILVLGLSLRKRKVEYSKFSAVC
jgi:hypothetical protein